MGAAECKGCSTSDPTSDTVKVSPTLLADTNGKATAAAPGQLKDQSAEEQQLEREAEEQRAREAAAEEERQKREAEERRRLEAEAEQARLERERAEERERAAREEGELAAREREAQERAAAQEAARRQELEEQARLAQESAAAELKEAEEKVGAFLRARGFSKGIAAAKKSCTKTSYPLHAAVEENNAEMVEALLKCGADRAAKNSAGLTPQALAQKLHKKRGSHADVLRALGD